MPDPSRASSDLEPIESAAAAWVVRLSEGLKPDEEADLAAWLAADPRHEAALAEFQHGWDRFAPVAAEVTAASATSPGPDATLVSGVFPRRRALRYATIAFAAAAAVALGLNLALRPAPQASTRPPLLPLCEERTLADGSMVELNRGAEITVAFTAGERRVELVRGEAHFTVTKNPVRPFIVTAGGVQVRAVGTAFNVRLDAVAVEVVVTEGSVRVNPPVAAAVGEELPMLHAGDHTAVPLAPVATAALPVVVALAPDALAARLAWQPRLLEFDDVPLSEIVAEFNRRNPARLTIEGTALGALRLTATVRSDNMDGFVRLMESNYGVRVEPRGTAEIVLRRD